MRIQIANNSSIYRRAVFAGRTMSLLVLSTRAKISPCSALGTANHAWSECSGPATTPLLPKSNRYYQTIHRLGALPRIQHQQGIDVDLLHHAPQVEAEVREFA